MILNVLTMVKYRPSRKLKKVIQKVGVKNADTTLLFNMNKIDPSQPLLCEGEIDCLAVLNLVLKILYLFLLEQVIKHG